MPDDMPDDMPEPSYHSAWNDPDRVAKREAADAALAAYEAKHQGPDIQSFEEFNADCIAGRDYVSLWEARYGPIGASPEERADYLGYEWTGYPDYSDYLDEAAYTDE